MPMVAEKSSIREHVVDMSDPREKSLLMNMLRTLTGLRRITVTAYRESKTDPQRKYYFAEPVRRFQEFMEDQGQFFSKDDCHEFFKNKFLPEPAPIIDKVSGAVVGSGIRSITTLTTAEMSTYIDNVRMWLLDTLNVNTEDPR